MIIETALSASVACLLGMRHGLDADHLAAIDAMTRWRARRERRFSCLCGLFFSAGHAAVILTVAIVFSVVAQRIDPPSWLASLGLAISAATLLVLGALNLREALAVRPGGPVRPIGIRSRLLAPLMRLHRLWQVALVGALFAVSFDAVAIAGLFAASSANALGAFGIGCAFAVGMLATGTANGLWVSRLLRQSLEVSHRAGRIMAFTIGSIALGVGASVLLPVLAPDMASSMEGHELVVSALVVTLILCGPIFSLIVERCHAPNDDFDGRRAGGSLRPAHGAEGLREPLRSDSGSAAR